MSNSTALGIKAAAWMNDTPEPPTRIVNMNHLGRALLEYDSPSVDMLFVYNCNPLATMPDQNRVLEGLQHEDLFTVVFDQVFTDTARYADVVLPSTTFFENYDIARGYPLDQPAARPAGHRTGRRGALEPRSVLAARRAAGRRRGGGGDRHADAHLRAGCRNDRRRAHGTRLDHTAFRRCADPVRRRLSADGGPEGAPVPETSSTGRRQAGSTATGRIRRRSATRSRSSHLRARRRCRR